MLSSREGAELHSNLGVLKGRESRRLSRARDAKDREGWLMQMREVWLCLWAADCQS